MEEAVQDVMKQTASISGTTPVMPQMAPQDVAAVNTDDAPVVRLVNSILEQSVKEKASDIHIEPTDSTTNVRMRIDGTLFLTTEIPKNLHAPLIARIKILWDGHRRKERPQDGRILIKVGGKKMDIRVSTLPSISVKGCPPSPRRYEHIGIEKLGFEHEQAETLRRSNRPHGIILVTGRREAENRPPYIHSLS